MLHIAVTPVWMRAGDAGAFRAAGEGGDLAGEVEQSGGCLAARAT
ncbi:hypothetical protein [Frankia sp. CcI49]|nr:hypothetical protein [Frankia sp. CcI49]